MTSPAPVRVASEADVPPGSRMIIRADNRTLALFNVDGVFYAVDNMCPHRGGPLGDGDLEGRIVTCPWHGWAWDVSTGANVNNPAVTIGCYSVSVRDGGVFVGFVAPG